MPPQNQAPELSFNEKEDLMLNANVDIAKKLFYGWVANELLSFDEFYILFDILKVRLP